MHIPITFGNNNNPLNTSSPVKVLAGDIGGTKTNLALFEFSSGKFSILKEMRLITKDFSDLGKMIASFMPPEEKPDVMSFGVAGPITENRVKITNVSWDIDGEELSNQYNGTPTYLINDLEATAYGLAVLTPDELYPIYKSGKETRGNLALIAPGTGLGEAGVYDDGTNYHPFGTEGGHSDFAPRTLLDYELYSHLSEQFGHVSWERVVSGNGIVSIFDFLANEKSRNVPVKLKEALTLEDKPKVITDNIENYDICRETADLFIRYLATEAGNLALKMKATGGVFIGGGIIPKILEHVDKGQFMTYFRDFGRMSKLLEDISVSVILNEKTALLGAAYYGAGRPELHGKSILT